MWQNNAESSRLSKFDEKFVSTPNTEKDAQVTEIEVTDSSKVTTSQDLIENSSEILNDDTVEDDDEVEGPESAVFRNHVLLKLIGKNLDFPSLKSVRSLNWLCKEVVTPQLTRKSRRIALVPGTKSQEQLEVVKNLKGIPELKIDVRLWNKCKFGFEQEGEMFTEILQELSPSLKALELDIWANEAIPLPSTSIQFPALSTLIIRDFDLEEEKWRRLLELIYASAPNLNALVVVEYFYPEFISLLLSADGSRNWALAPKLSSLTATVDAVSSEVLQILLKFPQTWQRLDLDVRFGDDNYQDIALLLEKNKDSLVSLEIFIEDLYIPQTLRFPRTLPKLQKLELYLPECKVRAGGSSIYYSQTFPALTYLYLFLDYFEYWEDYDIEPPQVWRSFFPNQVFNGLKCLKLDYLGLEGEEGYSPDWAQRMFPNARLEINA